MRITQIACCAGAALLGCGVLPAGAEQLRAASVSSAPDQVITITHRVYRGSALFAFQNFTLTADQFDVYRTGRWIKKLVATGHVRLVIRKAPRPARCTATGGNATYDVRRDEITMKGGVTVVAYGFSMFRGWTEPKMTTIRMEAIRYKPDEFPDFACTDLEFTPAGSSNERFFLAEDPETQYGRRPGRKRPSH